MPDHLPGSMEISKSLHEEIVAVQRKLQRAILEHQVRERKRERERATETGEKEIAMLRVR